MDPTVATDATWRDLAGARWASYRIPGSTLPVQLTRLSVDPDGGYTVVVRFPAGWERPATGYYEAAEEVLFLAGAFEMSGVRYAAGDGGWFPSRYRRAGTRSTAGALALAWFSGPDGWAEGVAAEADRAERGVRRHRWSEVAADAPTPLGFAARCLHEVPGRSSWLADRVPDGAVVPTTAASVEVFDLATHRYARAVTGAAVPAVPVGPAWVRLVVGSG